MQLENIEGLVTTEERIQELLGNDVTWLGHPLVPHQQVSVPKWFTGVLVVVTAAGKEVHNGVVHPSLQALLASGVATRDPETLFTHWVAIP